MNGQKRRVLVVSDGTFSMDGDQCALDDLEAEFGSIRMGHD